MSESLETRILTEFKAGQPLTRIAINLKVSLDVVYKALATNGITDATPTSAIVLQRHAEGASVGTIARELGIGRSAVIKYLPYASGSGPRRPWTDEEDAIVLTGGTPDGRTRRAANLRRHRLKAAPAAANWSDCPLRQRRLAEHLTQAELAQISDVPVATIRAFEQGKRDICVASIQILERLSGALRCENYRDILSDKG